MIGRSRVVLSLRTGIILMALASAASAEVVMTTEGWENHDTGFTRMTERVQSLHGRNLLARKGVRLVLGEDANFGDDPQMLTDGQTGRPREEGRVFIGGQPAVFAFYLGEPKTIKEIGAFTFNGDTRANQDFEVRVANNSGQPGVQPKFPDAPLLTTGDQVLGQNGGGFHVRFIDGKAGPLVPEKVDWVQFRVWPTLSAQADQPAKVKQGRGASTYIELEVLGEEHDVVLPTPEELARLKAIQEAPKAPSYEKRSTWRETLIAGREAILAWESQQDELALPDAGLSLGPWHLLGPLPRTSKEAAEMERAAVVDLAQRFPGKDGRQFGWEKREALKDGVLVDLGDCGADKDEVIYLCREVTLSRDFDRNQLFASASLSDGWVRWLPKGETTGIRGPVTPNARIWDLLGAAGRCQILIRMNASQDGRRQLWFALQTPNARPGAGHPSNRVGRRTQLFNQVRQEFPDPIDQIEMGWEAVDDFWTCERRPTNEWLPGQADAFLADHYRDALRTRLGRLKVELTEESGVRAAALAPLRERITVWIEQLAESLKTDLDLAALRQTYQQVAVAQELIACAGQTKSMRLSVEDQREMFGDRYPKSGPFLARIGKMTEEVEAAWSGLLAQGPLPAIAAKEAAAAGSRRLLEKLVAVKAEVDAAGREVLLENPLLAFDKLLVVKGNPGFSSNWDGPNRLGNEICVLSPVRPDGQITTVYQGGVSDLDLHWDGRRLLFCDGRTIWEMNADGSGLRRVSAEDPPVSHYDACYLPDGKIVCASNACEQAVPCTGGANVGNLHILDADGSNERRATYDQDHNWNPVVMNDGRVLYTRWEYTDTPHYFTRLLFRMNPDGTGQMEYYGSNSYWPNAMYWPRPIPGHPTMVVCVVSGHHGVSRVGELVLLDPARGRHEADGAVQQIPGYGKKVQPIIRDNLVGESWPKFAAPYPLAEPGTNLGAGKYFLVCVKNDEWAPWNLCLVDIYDNITPILEGGWMTPIPLRARPMPPVLASHINLARNDAVIYLADIYQGGGLRGYPRGSIKALRVGSHHYRFAGNGDTRASSYEGGWDVKKILGTVPVHEDGSALFRVPANTPIFVQPLDAEGKAQQQMRSWYTGMPGEVASCVGCHERQNNGPPNRNTIAARYAPSEITPWCGPTRGFSFDREVQPLLDRRCAGCHNGQPYQDGMPVQGSPRPLAGEGQGVRVGAVTLDLRAKQLRTDWTGDYSPAYMELQRYVRRAGYESDYHMPAPAEFEPDTSMLVQMLKKGHYHVELTREEWERLYTWIDYNVPYPINWRESHRPPRDEQVELRVKYKKLYANLDDHDEEPAPLPAVAAFEQPKPVAPRPASPTCERWPLEPEQAKELQAQAGPVEKELDLGDGVTMKFALVPAGKFVMGDRDGFDDEAAQAVASIDRPFYLARFEVTNRQYARYNPAHDSAYVDGRWKDRTTRGYPINGPDQPAVRVSWNEAMGFCRWLSEKTGVRATLPTEAQWEWACRAGTAAPWSFGEYKPGMTPAANIADESARGWNFDRAERGYNDGSQFTSTVGRYAPNAWGLCDMHGNVAEWCLSTYRPYPYNPRDGRDDANGLGMKVVRGGSWNDLMRFAASASRWRYQPYQPVYNVGFRVLVEAGASATIAQSP